LFLNFSIGPHKTLHTHLSGRKEGREESMSKEEEEREKGKEAMTNSTPDFSVSKNPKEQGRVTHH
jgi:hypothetical protein